MTATRGGRGVALASTEGFRQREHYGCTLDPDGDTSRLNYGAADSCIGLATGSMRACLEWLEQHH